MKKTLIVTSLGLMALMPAVASAQSAGVSASVTASTTAVKATMSASAMTAAKAKAGKELDRRIAALEALKARVNGMQKVTDSFKQSLATTVDTQLAAFVGLKAKIDAETDGEALKADVQSITQSYRVYSLVLPQIHISAAADRIVTTTVMMQTLGNKLAARAQAVANAGGDVSAISTSLTNLSNHITSASNGAQTAVSSSVTLTPDNGDKDKMASNAAALKAARTKLTEAAQDLAEARKDIAAVVSGLNKAEASLKATAAASTTVSQ